jgi:glycosyltransferase involved in cell wall biosynthesis
LLTSSAATGHVHAMMNGVDTRHFEPAHTPHTEPREIVFTGAMDYFPNIDGAQWFADEVWPRLRGTADCRFTIVGSRPAKSVRALALRDGIEVTGTVPDVRPYLHRAAVAVVPLRIARGVQNKLLEAMAAGVAVVATPPAVAAFDDVKALPVRVASTAAEFAQVTAELLADDKTRTSLGRAAREYVERHHDWEPMLDRFCRLVETCGGTARCA